jgi:hypothetical protein
MRDRGALSGSCVGFENAAPLFDSEKAGTGDEGRAASAGAMGMAAQPSGSAAPAGAI